MVKYSKYKTKSGKELWKYYGYLGIDEKTGEKIKPRAQGFTSKAAAKLDYNRAVHDFNTSHIQSEKGPIKFEQLFKEFLVYYKDSGITPGTYRKFEDEMIRYSIPSLGKMYVNKIDVDDCQKVFDNMKRKRKDYHKIKNQLKTILDFGITKQYIKTNPMDYILIGTNNFRYKKRRLSSSENFYSPEQLMDFLEAYQEVEDYHKFVYFRLLAFTGLRRGEALALYETDLLRKERAIDVNKTLAEDENGKTYVKFFPKTDESENLVYLDDDTYNYVYELIKNRNTHERYGKMTYIHNGKYLFPSPKTKIHYSRNAPNDWLNNFFVRNKIELDKRGIHRISPHGFRHSQASLLFELGVDPKNAQHRLRHKNLKTTMDIYTHLSEQQKRTPILKLDEFSSKGTTSGTTLSQDKEKKS